MTELFDLVREMLMLAVTLIVPLALAAAAGAVVGGLAIMGLGLQDQAVAGLLRAAAVVLAVGATGAAGFDQAVSLTRTSWEHIERVGQRGIAAAPDGS